MQGCLTTRYGYTDLSLLERQFHGALGPPKGGYYIIQYLTMQALAGANLAKLGQP